MYIFMLTIHTCSMYIYIYGCTSPRMWALPAGSREYLWFSLLAWAKIWPFWVGFDMSVLKKKRPIWVGFIGDLHLPWLFVNDLYGKLGVAKGRNPEELVGTTGADELNYFLLWPARTWRDMTSILAGAMVELTMHLDACNGFDYEKKKSKECLFSTRHPWSSTDMALFNVMRKTQVLSRSVGFV